MNPKILKYLIIVKPALKIAAFVVSMLLYATTVFAAYGGYFNPDFFTLPSVMTLMLPYLATAALIVTVIWLCCCKLVPGCIGVLSLLVAWGPVTTACPLGWSKSPTPGTQSFTLLSFNMIHGWDLENKDSTANRTIEYILNSGADIVCVQELKKLDASEVPGLSQEQKARISTLYPFYEGDPRLDLKVFSKFPVVFVPGDKYIKREYDKKRYAFFKLNINGHELTLVNMHLKSFRLSSRECDEITDFSSPGSMRQSLRLMNDSIYKKLDAGFVKRKLDAEILRETLDRINGPLIVCGDFNDVPASYAYRLIRGDDLKDAYVETNFGPMITYNRHAFLFHLDQILYRGPLKALSVDRGSTKVSDHYPVLAKFEFIDNL